MPFRYTFLVLLFISKASFAQSGFQFESDKSRIVIPFKLINNLIFIPIQVNGIELNFLVDSGVEETILIGLEEKKEISFNNVKKIKLRGYGNEEAIEGLKSSNNILSLKSLVDRNHELYIILDQNFNFSSHIGIPVNGIIGYHFFKNNLIEINYTKKQLIVYNEKLKLKTKKIKNYKPFPITIENNKPYLTANIIIKDESIPSKLLIDSGNSDALWLFQNSTNSLEKFGTVFEDYLGKGFSGDIYGYRSKIAKLQLQHFELSNPIVALPDSISIKRDNLVVDRSGSIGGEILKRFTIIFDYSNHNIYLKKSAFFDDPFTYNMSGIELQNDGTQWIQETVQMKPIQIDNTYDNNGEKAQNNFKYKFALKPIFSIVNIRKNSPADLCGLQKGDIIISINSRPAYVFKLEEFNELLKSEEGKWITLEIERNDKKITYKFQLKSIL